MAELQKQAQEKFGTDDVKKLEAILNRIRSENEKMRSDYQDRLDEVEKTLQKVESEFENED